MKIGLDAKRAYHNRTGLGNYSRTIIQALFQLYPDNNYFLFTPSVTDLFDSGKLGTEVSPKGVQRLLAGYWRSFGVSKVLEEKKISVYHGLTNEIPLNLSTSVSALVTIHDLIFLRFPQLYPAWDAYIYKKKVKFACQEADKIIAISAQTRDDLVDFLQVPESKIEVIYQDCNEVYHRQPDKKLLDLVAAKYNLPENYILSVGTLEERKNQLLILKALRQLGKEFNLVLVGKSGGYKKVLTNYIEANQLESQVVFLENVDLEHLPALYRMASVFVYPSVFEGFGIPVLEALNCRVPVITANGSCLRETGGPGAFYINPQDEEELASKIRMICESPDLADRMTTEGAAHALSFRKEKTTAQLMSVYRQL